MNFNCIHVGTQNRFCNFIQLCIGFIHVMQFREFMLLFSSSSARVETLQITQKYVRHLRETVHPLQGHRTLRRSTNWRILTANAYCNWLLLSVYHQESTRALLNNENRYDTSPFFFCSTLHTSLNRA